MVAAFKCGVVNDCMHQSDKRALNTGNHLYSFSIKNFAFAGLLHLQIFSDHLIIKDLVVGQATNIGGDLVVGQATNNGGGERKIKRRLTTPDFMLRTKSVPSLKRMGNFSEWRINREMLVVRLAKHSIFDLPLQEEPSPPG